MGVEAESSGTFAGGSLERKSWEGSVSARLILTVHSAPHRRRVMVSGEPRDQNKRCEMPIRVWIGGMHHTCSFHV